jgi:hypothetical protein
MRLARASSPAATGAWLVVGAVLLAPGLALAWPSSLGEAAARDARRLLPRSLAAALAARQDAIRVEMERLPQPLLASIELDRATGRLRPETVAAINVQMDEILALFRKRQVGDGLVRLGALAHLPMTLSDPVLVAPAPGIPERVSGEYYLFVQTNLAKIPVVVADAAALELGRADLPAHWQRVLDESRAQAAVIPAEMLRDGRVVDHRSIDYRSPVFGVASLSYSRAVTAIAATWLVVWREARGDLSLRPKPIEVTPLSPVPAQLDVGGRAHPEEKRP